MEYDANYSSSNNIFSPKSYESAKAKSGRSLEIDVEEKVPTFEDIKGKFSNDIVIKVIEKSIFKFHTNKKGQEPFIIYDEIKIGDRGEKINNIEEIKKASSSNKILNDNYNKFIKYLEEIENKIKNEFIHEYKLTITLKFESNFCIQNNFNIICLYIVNIQEEDPIEFKDENILLNASKQGLSFLITEVNKEAYKDLEYK